MNFINLEIEQGVSYQLELTYTDETTGLPKDLTGYSARLSVKPYADQPPAIDLRDSDGSIVLGGSSGSIAAYFSPGSTATVDWNQAPYDLILKDSFGVRVKVTKGLVTILPTESDDVQANS